MRLPRADRGALAQPGVEYEPVDAAELGVHPNTLRKVYASLESQGYATTRHGSGTVAHVRDAAGAAAVRRIADGALASARSAGADAELVALAILGTDVVFAIDSVPAVYGITGDPYLVFVTNAFALLGLRALYFVLEGALGRLRHLGYGLSVILAFIGVKLVLEALHSNELHWVNGGDPVAWAPVVPIWLSLSVIVGVLAVTTVLSLVVAPRRAARREARLAAHARAAHHASASAHR